MKTFDCQLIALQKKLKKFTLLLLQKDLFLSDTKLLGLDFGVSGVRDESA